MSTMTASTSLGLLLLLAIPTYLPAQSSRTKGGIAAATSHDTDASLKSGDQTRQYRLYVPAESDRRTPLPLILLFHGTGGTSTSAMSLSDLNRVAEREKFIIAAPQGAYALMGGNSWNADLDPAGVNDVGFVRNLIGEIRSQVPMDDKRIYAMGFSAGARMSSRLACEMPDVIVGIGAVAGLQFPENCSTTRAVPVIAFHGAADGVRSIEVVEASVFRWVQHNGCNQAPRARRVSQDVTRINYGGCDGDAEVVFYRVDNGGHAWPDSPLAERLEGMGLGKVNRDINATDLMWRFLKAHSLP